MKMSIVISLVICLSSLLHAETLTTSVAAPTVLAEEALKAGRLKLGGGFGWTQTKDYSYQHISPSIQYFVSDNLSLGASLSYGTGSGDFSSTSIGPALDYYFYHKNQLAFYFSQEISLSNYYGADYYGDAQSQIGTSSLGTLIFLNQNVAFGVELSRSYSLKNDNNDNGKTYLSGNFSIFY